MSDSEDLGAAGHPSKEGIRLVIGRIGQQVKDVFELPATPTDRKETQRILMRAKRLVEALQEAKLSGFKSGLAVLKRSVAETIRVIRENPSILLVLPFASALAAGDELIGPAASNLNLKWQTKCFLKAVNALPDVQLKTLMQEFARVAQGVRDWEMLKTLQEDEILTRVSGGTNEKTHEGELRSCLDKVIADFHLAGADGELLNQSYRTPDFNAESALSANLIPVLREGLKSIERQLRL